MTAPISANDPHPRARWAATSPIPKLLIVGKPGGIGAGPALELCRTWPHQREVTVAGRHFLQEDSPHEIGAALRDFLIALRDPAARPG